MWRTKHVCFAAWVCTEPPKHLMPRRRQQSAYGTMSSNASDSGSQLRVLVTGANSGLGLAICTRLIDEFFSSPSSQAQARSSLTLILTTRSLAKSNATTQRLQRHISDLARSNRSLGDIPGRVNLQPEQLDLTSIVSIRRLAQKLTDQGHALDVVICNAGVGGWTTLNWPLAIWLALTDMVHAFTFPPFKVSGVGWTTKSQFGSVGKHDDEDGGRAGRVGVSAAATAEEALGEVFMANVFGHYMLGHWLAPLMGGSMHGGRIVWMSSIEAYARTLDMNDFQGLKSTCVYEQTKRITDVLVLASELPTTRSLVQDYLSVSSRTAGADDAGAEDAWKHSPSTSSYDDADQSLLDSQLGVAPAQQPRLYLAHPGICATSIFTLPLVLEWLMIAALYLVRFLGSPWHTCATYKGACAPVWLALLSAEDLDRLEHSNAPSETAMKGTQEQRTSRKSKWGSAVSRLGDERVVRTETEGWGFAGRVGEGAEWRSGFQEGSTKGRWRHASTLTQEGREEFEVVGREVWREMERLREYWEERLKENETAASEKRRP